MLKIEAQRIQRAILFAGSWIEAEGGLSRWEMRSVPPAFWASPGDAAVTKAAQDAARIAQRAIRVHLETSRYARGALGRTAAMPYSPKVPA